MNNQDIPCSDCKCELNIETVCYDDDGTPLCQDCFFEWSCDPERLDSD